MFEYALWTGYCSLKVVSTSVGGVPEVLPPHLIRLAKPSAKGIILVYNYWINLSVSTVCHRFDNFVCTVKFYYNGFVYNVFLVTAYASSRSHHCHTKYVS